eukprot:3425902-Amphidinium_carterae.1
MHFWREMCFETLGLGRGGGRSSVSKGGWVGFVWGLYHNVARSFFSKQVIQDLVSVIQLQLGWGANLRSRWTSGLGASSRRKGEDY